MVRKSVSKISPTTSYVFLGTSLVLGPGNAPKASWAAPSSVSTDTMKVRSQRSLLLAVDRRVIHRTFRKRSFCVNGSPALFPDRGVQFGVTVGRNVRKARHFAVSAHRRSDPAEIAREAPPNGAFERSWGPKTRDVPQNRTRWSVIF